MGGGKVTRRNRIRLWIRGHDPENPDFSRYRVYNYDPMTEKPGENQCSLSVSRDHWRTLGFPCPKHRDELITIIVTESP